MSSKLFPGVLSSYAARYYVNGFSRILQLFVSQPAADVFILMYIRILTHLQSATKHVG